MIIHVLHCPTCQRPPIVRHQDPSRQATVPLSREPLCGSPVSPGLYLPGTLPEVKPLMVDMVLNASGSETPRACCTSAPPRS
jgi:hypothetical protein